MARFSAAAFILCLCGTTWTSASRAAGDVWAASYDAATGTRYIPLGLWKQGETREFQYRCWYGSGGSKRVRATTSIITIEKIAFDFAGLPFSLQVRWILKRGDDPRKVDNRVYVFAPGRGAVSVR